MTLERHSQDAHQLTLHLTETHGKEKICLVGHSGGRVLGLELAHRYLQDRFGLKTLYPVILCSNAWTH